MNQWRAKNYNLTIGSSKELLITVRRFRTAKQNRSKKFKQIIIPFDAGGVREFALRIKVKRRPGRPASKPNRPRYLSAIAPASMVILGVAGIIFFSQHVNTLHSVDLPKSVSSGSVAPVPSAPSIKPLPYSVPTHISIPSQYIDASVTPVGQAPDGSIQMPPILDWTTGWYEYSPTPGQIGPAIIVGHVDTYKSIWVFWRLRYLGPGDMIYVTRADGSTADFQVTAIKQFSQAAFPASEVYGNINYPGLRLITCGGTFSTQTGNYNENTVVYAKMVGSS